MRRVLVPSPIYSAAESARLFKGIHELITALLSRGIPVILDATNLSELHRERLYSIAEHTGAKLVLVNIVAPPQLVKERLKARAEGNGGGYS